jgi:transposase
VPNPGSSWQRQGRPTTQPHEYIRGGTCKVLTLFQPKTGQVHVQPISSCTNLVLHGWLKERLSAIVAALPVHVAPIAAAAKRAAWESWQEGLTERFILPDELPPLRLLLVWDNLAGHAEMVLWLCRHGIMPLYTPLAGSWLNMAESIQRILKRRALDGQYPHSAAEIGDWFEQTAQAWNQHPTPFLWNGKRQQRRRKQLGDKHPIGGSAAHTQHPIFTRPRRRKKWHVPSQVTH